jgi:DNA primase
VRFSPETLDQIRSSTDIVDLIGGYVKLKKRGKTFLGLCPFHTEKTPSFNVSPERQMYHCFGCGVGGNAITFIMEYEKVSFPEAVRTLAERAGIALPELSAGDEAAASESEALYEACAMAGRFFFDNLMDSTEGQLALKYFHHRGFSDDTIRKFGLGYALNAWDALIQHAGAKGVSAETLEKAGLARKRDDGGYYDYFRGRAMFPIFSTSGRVIGFGARKLREDDPLGKYINSPETPIYNKSRALYGMYHAKESIREKDTAILVEGYADLISLVQAGIPHVVASSGTALTVEQVQLLSRYTKNIVIVYDADSAGSKAALRGVDLILENDLDVSVVRLPAGEDPDSFVKKNGASEFKKLLNGAVSFVDFIAGAYEQVGKLQTPEGQADAVRAIIRAIGKMKDELKRHFYVKHVAERYRLYESMLYRELEKVIPQPASGARLSVRKFPLADREPAEARQPTESAISPWERDLLHALLEGRNDVAKIVFEQITVADFAHPQARRLAELIKDRWDVEGTIDSSHLLNEVEEEPMRRLIAELVFSKYEISKGWKASGVDVTQADALDMVKDAISDFRRRTLMRKLEENQRHIREASDRGEDVVPLLGRRQELLTSLKTLDSLERF